MDHLLLHIISRDDLADAYRSGLIEPESLATEGFVHCSYPQQVLIPANERFAGREDLVLLVLAPGDLDAELVVEDSYGSGLEFPHVYGPIPVRAIRKVLDFPPNSDRSFSLPELPELPEPA